jgi:hypothetical protein
MPHTPTSLFADMLGLLKELEWAGSWADSPVMPDPYRACPTCHAKWAIGKHKPGCHLQATIALAEEQVRNLTPGE